MAKPTTTGAVSAYAACTKPATSTAAQTPSSSFRGRISIMELYYLFRVIKEEEPKKATFVDWCGARSGTVLRFM
uniref:Uncharacterized protein n=1 Tax=Leersia perrieri TaxID=77586 RepID=A0A0D9VRU4_9ORYZ